MVWFGLKEAIERMPNQMNTIERIWFGLKETPKTLLVCMCLRPATHTNSVGAEAGPAVNVPGNSQLLGIPSAEGLVLFQLRAEHGWHDRPHMLM